MFSKADYNSFVVNSGILSLRERLKNIIFLVLRGNLIS